MLVFFTTLILLFNYNSFEKRRRHLVREKERDGGKAREEIFCCEQFIFLLLFLLLSMYTNRSFVVCNATLRVATCTITGSSNVITGDDNIIDGSDNEVYGHCNTIRGRGNVVHGHHNTVRGSENAVHGNDNCIEDRISVTHGHRNRLVDYEHGNLHAHLWKTKDTFTQASQGVYAPRLDAIARETTPSAKWAALQSQLTPATAHLLSVQHACDLLRLFPDRQSLFVEVWRHLVGKCCWINTHSSIDNVTLLLDSVLSEEERVSCFINLWRSTDAPTVALMEHDPHATLSLVSHIHCHLPLSDQLRRRLVCAVLLDHPRATWTSSFNDHTNTIASWLTTASPILEEWICKQVRPRTSTDSLPLDLASRTLATLLGALEPPTWNVILGAWLPRVWPYAIIVQDVIDTLRLIAPTGTAHLPNVEARLDAFCVAQSSVSGDGGGVAAVAIARVVPVPAAAAAAAPPTSKDLLAQVIDEDWSEAAGHAESSACVVCLAHIKKVVLLPCRHLCLCGACASDKQTKACPVCRTAITSRLPVY
jgi:hypothetical protein